jgi:cellulose synthase/poly-beta-1,6-N-acetylglucosamine synthase-like glycosyltransferase
VIEPPAEAPKTVAPTATAGPDPPLPDGPDLAAAVRAGLGPLAAAAARRPAAVRITAVVPVYDTPVAFLDACLRSLLRQTVPAAGLLVVDDGSRAAPRRRNRP